MRENTILKKNAIRERFKYLYDVERIRCDDVLERLAKEFHLSVVTIRRAVSKEIKQKSN